MIPLPPAIAIFPTAWKLQATRRLTRPRDGAASVKEPGCRRFDILNLASDPNHFLLYEVYDNEAALKSHRETAHFKKYAETTAKMVAKRDGRPMSVIASNSQAK
jgi:quinol monooxygenase YgiN